MIVFFSLTFCIILTLKKHHFLVMQTFQLFCTRTGTHKSKKNKATTGGGRNCQSIRAHEQGQRCRIQLLIHLISIFLIVRLLADVLVLSPASGHARVYHAGSTPPQFCLQLSMPPSQKAFAIRTSGSPRGCKFEHVGGLGMSSAVG